MTAATEGEASALALDARGVTVARGDLIVLSRINVALGRGSLVALVGPAGAGKSSLLHCLLGLLQPRAGRLEVLGRAPSAARPLVGYVPQDRLVDWSFPVSLAEIVMMGRYGRLGLFNRPSGREQGLVERCLEQVGLARRADAPAGDLSRAERPRAMLARALVQEPELLLLDEIFEGLDPETEQSVFEVMRSLRQRGKTVILATRALLGVQERFEEVVLLNGRVVAQGPPAKVFTQAHLEATYGSYVLPVKVEAGYFAIDTRSSER